MSGPIDLPLAPAGEADHAEIVALANSAYRGEGGWNSEAGLIEGERSTLAFLRADLAANPNARLYIHRDPATDRLLACVRLLPLGEGEWHLGLLAVQPDLQAQGLGRRMLDASEAHVRGQGGRRVVMGVVDVRDTLIAWYERRGYRRTGATEPFPYGDERFGRPLRDDFCFVVLEKLL